MTARTPAVGGFFTCVVVTMKAAMMMVLLLASSSPLSSLSSSTMSSSSHVLAFTVHNNNNNNARSISTRRQLEEVLGSNVMARGKAGIVHANMNNNNKRRNSMELFSSMSTANSNNGGDSNISDDDGEENDRAYNKNSTVTAEIQQQQSQLSESQQQEQQQKHQLATQIEIVKEDQNHENDDDDNRYDDSGNTTSMAAVPSTEDNPPVEEDSPTDTFPTCTTGGRGDSFIADHFNNVIEDDPLTNDNRNPILMDHHSVVTPMDDDDDDDDHTTPIKKTPRTKTLSPNQRSFVKYLDSILNKTNGNMFVTSNCLDDELKRMESRYYELGGDEVSDCHFPYDPYHCYAGSIVRPPLEAYERVCHAYNASRIGVTAALRVEDVIDRYERYYHYNSPSSEYQYYDGDHDDDQASVLPSKRNSSSQTMIKLVMNIWIQIGHIKRAQFWLQQLESILEDTKSKQDLLDPGKVYNPFLQLLRSCSAGSSWIRRDYGIGRKAAADLSMQCIHQMRYQSTMLGGNPYALPTRRSYVLAMHCQLNAYTGIDAYRRVETLFEYIQEDFQKTVNDGKINIAIQRSKPTAVLASCVLNAASECTGRDTVEIRSLDLADRIFYEYFNLYSETNDDEYRPNALMYESLFSIFDNVLPYHSPRRFANQVFGVLNRMDDDNIRDVKPKKITYALNKVMLSAERLLHKHLGPNMDPTMTRAHFVVVLNAFKKHHDRPSGVTANKGTYEIFLRACTHVPHDNGVDELSQLAVRAFVLCQDNGWMTQTIAKLFEEVVPPEVSAKWLSNLPRNPNTNEYIFPHSWTRKIITKYY